jgi:leader peptidase (prepilin peptidase)/N-methyltransferase
MDTFPNVLPFLEHVNTMQPWLLPMAVLVYSAIAGSFITCAVHRVPTGASLRNPPSHCPSCKNTLGIAQLIPIFSYIYYRGKCAFCGTKVPLRYLMIELSAVLIGLLSWFYMGLSFSLIPLLLCGWGFLFFISCFLLEKHISVKVLLFSIICFFVLFV